MENIEEKAIAIWNEIESILDENEILPPGTVEMDDWLSRIDERWKETEKRIIESIRRKLIEE